MAFGSRFRNFERPEDIFSDLGAQSAVSAETVGQLEGAKIYDLEQMRYAGMPAPAVLTPPYQYILHRRHEDTLNREQSGPRSGASGALITTDHTGTHVDALCHQADELKLNGGVAITPAVETTTGFTQAAADSIAPFIVQGFLLDVAYSKGVEALPDGYVITAEDLDAARKAQGQMILPGGLILVRTGFGRFWDDPARYAKAAGMSPDANRWILGQHPKAVGADNLMWDAPAARDEQTGATLFGHLELLARNGIFIFENLNLETLAADHVDHFLFIAVPLKLKGATASPVRPLAIEIQASGLIGP